MADTKPEAEALLPTVGSHWLHRKSGGTYYVLAVGKIEADLIPAVVYQSTYDDKVWVRPLANFMDGRFEQTPDPRAALPPKPLSVAPDDEANFAALQRCVSDSYGDDRDSQQVYEEGGKALEALRRRIAELKTVQEALKAVESLRDAAIRVGKVWEQSSHEQRARAETAEAALAACRDKTIEECAAAFEKRAAELGKAECCGFGVQSGYDPPECCSDPNYMISDRDGAAAIRALKDKENGNG